MKSPIKWFFIIATLLVVTVATASRFGQTGKFSNVSGTVTQVVLTPGAATLIFVGSGAGSFGFTCLNTHICDDLLTGNVVLISGDLVLGGDAQVINGELKGSTWVDFLVTDVTVLPTP